LELTGVPAGDLVWSRLTSPRSRPAVTEDAETEAEAGTETESEAAVTEAGTEAAAG
jgi:hypothetical protein